MSSKTAQARPTGHNTGEKRCPRSSARPPRGCLITRTILRRPRGTVGAAEAWRMKRGLQLHWRSRLKHQATLTAYETVIAEKLLVSRMNKQPKSAGSLSISRQRIWDCPE